MEAIGYAIIISMFLALVLMICSEIWDERHKPCSMCILDSKHNDKCETCVHYTHSLRKTWKTIEKMKEYFKHKGDNNVK